MRKTLLAWSKLYELSQETWSQVQMNSTWLDDGGLLWIVPFVRYISHISKFRWLIPFFKNSDREIRITVDRCHCAFYRIKIRRSLVPKDYHLFRNNLKCVQSSRHHSNGMKNVMFIRMVHIPSKSFNLVFLVHDLMGHIRLTVRWITSNLKFDV